MFTFEQIVKLARDISLDAYANQHLSRPTWDTDKLRFSANGEVLNNGRKRKRKWFFYSTSDIGDDEKRAFSPRYVISAEQAHRLRCRLQDLSRRLTESRRLASERLKEINGTPDTILWASGKSAREWSVLKLSPQGDYYFSGFLGDKEAEELSDLEKLAVAAFTATPAGELVRETVKLSRQLDNVWRLLNRCHILIDAQVGHIAKTRRPEGELTVIVRVRDEDFFVRFEERWPDRPAGGDKHKVVFSRRVQDPIPVLPATPFTFT